MNNAVNERARPLAAHQPASHAIPSAKAFLMSLLVMVDRSDERPNKQESNNTLVLTARKEIDSARNNPHKKDESEEELSLLIIISWV